MKLISDKEHPRAFHFRFAKLSLICAERSKHFLNGYGEQTLNAEDLIEKARRCLYGEYDISDLKRDCDKLRPILNELVSSGEKFHVIAYAAFSCLAAAESIVYGFENQLINSSELEIDVEDWDASFFSNIAFSGAATWEGKGNETKRREFWVWFLNDAIPRSWEIS